MTMPQSPCTTCATLADCSRCAKRHERAGEDCPLCRQGARDEQKVRDRRKAIA